MWLKVYVVKILPDSFMGNDSMFIPTKNTFNTAAEACVVVEDEEGDGVDAVLKLSTCNKSHR